MKIQSLVKLDLLAAAQERKLVETLSQHRKALYRYVEQKVLLTAYQERLRASWRSGAMIRAGDACRAAKFVAHADAAYQHLLDTIKTEQDNQTTCEVSLAALRMRRKKLHQRLSHARRLEEEQKLKKIEQAFSFMASSENHPLFFGS